MSILALILCSASVVLVAHATVCGVPPVSDLLPHDSSCNRSSQCQTNSCKNNTCVCPLDYYFHNCSSRCIPSCNKTLTTSSTFIASTSYPNNYSNNVYCFWTVVGLSGDVLSFSILDYALGGCCDNISVYDGINKKAAFLGNISQVNQTVVATSSLMYIVFTTDGSGVDAGFYGSVRSHECTSVITEPTGVISSPVYPYGDFRSGYCRWSIQGASRDEYIVISFHDFDVGPCANGNVTLSEGNKQVAHFCGAVLPTSVRSTSYYISLEYKTGNQSQLAYRGFNATYRIYNPSKGVTEELIGTGTSYFTATSGSITETSINKAAPSNGSTESPTIQSRSGTVAIEMSTSKPPNDFWMDPVNSNGCTSANDFWVGSWKVSFSCTFRRRFYTAPSAGTTEVLATTSATSKGSMGTSTSKLTQVTSTQALKCTPDEYDVYRCIWKDDTQYNAGCHHLSAQSYQSQGIGLGCIYLFCDDTHCPLLPCIKHNRQF